MSQTRILALVGSLRSASVNRKLAEAAAELAPEGAEVPDDVAGPSRKQLAALERHHRHRLLGAQPVGPAEQVLVQHEVPENDDAAAAKATDGRPKPFDGGSTAHRIAESYPRGSGATRPCEGLT